MFIPLVDILRCVKAHEDTWLVASIGRSVERDIVSGTLGCPICLAEYEIRDGVVRFGNDTLRAADRTPSESEAMRLAAGLDLTDPGKVAVLQGAWGAHAQLVRSLVPSQLLLVNPPTSIASGDGISIVLAEHAPIAYGSVDAVAVDDGASDGMVASLRSALRAGGRMLARHAVPSPAGLSELTGDGEVWVAELGAAQAVSAPVRLGRKERP